MSSSRGVVVYPEMRRTPTGGVTIVSSQIDPLSIRRAALYWDRIDRPHSRMLYVGLTTDEKELKAAGVLTESQVIDAVQTQETLLEVPGRVLMQLNAAEPGQWALAQSSPDLVLPIALEAPTRCLEVELHQALPVPAQDVPIQDILQFKYQRRDELLAFRQSMDDLYSKAIASVDAPRARDASLLELENRLRDVHRVVNETPWRRALSSLKVELSVADLALLGNVVDYPLAKLIGIAAASIKISGAIVAGLKNPIPGLRDFAYLGYAVKELPSVSRENAALPPIPTLAVETETGTVEFGNSRSRLSRGDLCYCGSGMKYKDCHGSQE